MRAITRAQLVNALQQALQRMAAVAAAWEGGSGCGTLPAFDIAREVPPGTDGTHAHP